MKGCRCIGSCLHIRPSAQAVLKTAVLANINKYLFFLLSCITWQFCAAQKHDTLRAVKVFAKKELNTAATGAPVNVLPQEELTKRNAVSVADLVKYFPGVNVKDYGGIGGLKTISVRGLGANHTGVMYDGLLLGDAQGGQTDLGRFSLTDLQQLALYNEGPLDILLPARAFASGSLLSLSTVPGKYKHTGTEIGVNMQQGSFGYFSPALIWRTNLGKKTFLSLSGSYLQAEGNYPFRSYEDEKLTETRNNSRTRSGRTEFNISHRFNDSNRLAFKAYYYGSKRGLPGSVILYNNISRQRLNDDNFFLQGNWRNKFSRKSSYLLSTKFSKDKTYYIDPSYPNSFGKLENEFHQQEEYFSAAYRYDLCKSLSASISGDHFHSKLRRTDFLSANFADPDRNSFLSNIALQYKTTTAEVNANLLYTGIRERVKNGKPGKDLDAFSPAISGSFVPFAGIPFRVRAFYKQVFRAPTFNDLYYTNIGNINLRPEYAEQFNAGMTFNSRPVLFFEKIVFTADAYHNNVEDRILAVPRQNLFQWSMQNVGKVKINGVDVAMHLGTIPYHSFIFTTDISYSFLEAIDRSDKSSSLYGSQLPYTPKHSGSLHLGIERKRFGFNYNMIFSSYRYRTGDAIPENLVQGWGTNDISLSYALTMKKNTDLRILAEANNIFNTQYEIIKFYPMPRFNYRIGIAATFKKNKTKEYNEKESF